MKSRLAVLAAGILTLLVASVAVPALAQESSGSSTTQNGSGGNSLRVAPVRSELAIDPGDTKKLTVYVQNLAPTPAQVRAVISDFEASKDESGEPLIILDDQYAKSHSLKRLTSVEPSQLTLPANARMPVELTITVPKNARAGGYFGVVRFLPASDITQDESGVAVSTNVASVVLLKVTGDLQEKMTLESMDVRQNDKVSTFFTSNKDIKAVVRFNNQGNVQIAPFGKIQLKDRSGKVIDEQEVNNTDPRGNVLPESIRRFELDLKKVGSFGKYTLEGNFGYGSKGELLTSSVSFWVVPTALMIAGGSVVVVAILGIVFVPRMVRSYNRRVVRRVGRRY